MVTQCPEKAHTDIWHPRPCGRPVKWVVIIRRRGFPTVKGYRCGIHAKQYSEKTLIEKEEVKDVHRKD